MNIQPKFCIKVFDSAIKLKDFHMRKWFSSAFLLTIVVLFTNNTYAQYTATWALTSAKTVAVSGTQAANVIALDMVPGSTFSGGTHNTDGFACANTASWPLVATNGMHLDFPLSPNAESNLTVTGLTAGVKISGSSGSQMFSLAYQVDGAGNWVTLGSPQEAQSGGSSTITFTSLNGAFDNAHSYVIRLYVYAKASGTSSSRKAYVKNVAFTGAATTANTPLISLSTSSLANFGTLLVGATSAEQSYTISGIRLTDNVIVSVKAPFIISADNVLYDTVLSFTQTGGALASTTVYVKMSPLAADGKITSVISHRTTGGMTRTIPVEGTVLALEPTTQSSISFGEITGKSIVINLAGGNGGRRIVIARAESAVNYVPIDGVAETGVSNNFTAATDQGNGNKIVFDGTETTTTISGLIPGKTYYFASYEYNAGTNNSQNYLTDNPGLGNKTTLAVPGLSVSSASVSFGKVLYNTTSAEKSYTVSGNFLTPADGNISVTAPTGFEISLVSGSGFDTVASVPYTAGTINAVQLYVRFKPTEGIAYSGNITHAGGGADLLSVTVSGTGVLDLPNPGNYDYVVAQDGSGGYTTVQAALNAIPLNNTTWKTVFIKKGLYVERDSTTKTQDKVIILGEDRDSTIIQYSSYSGQVLNGVTLATSTCQVLYINSSDVILKNLTVHNPYTSSQAVALNVHGDRIIVDNCKLIGYQDTYYTWGYGRFYTVNSFIEGATDYIFGRGAAIFDSCEIHSISKSSSTVTAPSTDTLWKFGYVFRNCRFTAGSGVSAIDLGRPWKPYGRCVIMNCEEGAHITAVGWRIWEGNNNHLTCYFAEYKNSGPGYVPGSRISWSHQLTDAEALDYTMPNIFAKNTAVTTTGAPFFIDDWMPVEVTDVKTSSVSPALKTYNLEQNYPNPFNPSTVIKYTVPAAGNVVLKVYDILGTEVATLVNEVKPAGEYVSRFNAEHLASGLYLYTLKSGNSIQSKKMLLIK